MSRSYEGLTPGQQEQESPRKRLLEGLTIPAHPLVLDGDRRLDASRQTELTNYYLDSGVGGIAIGVHTTQYAVHRPDVGLYRPLLELTTETVDKHVRSAEVVKVAGLYGNPRQVISEARLAAELGYDIGLLSMAAWSALTEAEIIDTVEQVTEVLPVFGFHPQPAVGGRPYTDRFWRQFVSIPGVHAIKIAAFDRYETLRVIRAVADTGRGRDVALYTGNDDNIVADLLTPFHFGDTELRIVGGLLGQWAVWTDVAVAIHQVTADLQRSDTHNVPENLLAVGAALTDANAAIFDARNRFAGCIPGIHEVLRRQGLLAGSWCLDPSEQLSPGQAEEISRVENAYPFLRSPTDFLELISADAQANEPARPFIR